MKSFFSFRSLLWVFLSGVLIAAVSGGLYTLYVFQSIRKTFRPAQKSGQLKYSPFAHDFDLGAFVSVKKLQHFYPFSATYEEKLGKKFFQSGLAKTGWKTHSALGQVLEPFSLKDILPNHCDSPYCFQVRVPFTEIPPALWRGLIGVEDQRFLEHSGVDLRSIGRAIVADIKAMSFVQGGSTLTQQLVKNIYFSGEKALSRKFKELFYSLIIESEYSKEEILSTYLNEVYWGSLGGVQVRGFYAAALFYFHKRAGELSEFEAAILVSMLKGPTYFSPLRNLERLQKRTESIFKKLTQLELYAAEGSSVWSEKQWKSWQDSLRERAESKFDQALLEAFRRNNSVLDPFEIFVFSHLSNFQKDFIKKRTLLAWEKEKMPDKLPEKLDLAVKAGIQPMNCEFPCEEQFQFYSKVERNLTQAFEKEKHQVGSILKPLSYKIFFEQGIDWSRPVSTRPIQLDLRSGPWSPRESSQLELPDTISVLNALQKSRNRPLIRLANQLGWEKMQQELAPFLPELKKPLKEFPSQLLGAIELTPQAVMRVFQKLTREQCQQVKSGWLEWKESVLYQLSDPNQTTLSRSLHPYFKELKFFGKTGTSNKGMDSWFIGMDGKLLYAIWLGQEGLRGSEVPPVKAAGSSGPFQIFQNFLLERGKNVSVLSCRVFF